MPKSQDDMNEVRAKCLQYGLQLVMLLDDSSNDHNTGLQQCITELKLVYIKDPAFTFSSVEKGSNRKTSQNEAANQLSPK